MKTLWCAYHFDGLCEQSGGIASQALRIRKYENIRKNVPTAAETLDENHWIYVGGWRNLKFSHIFHLLYKALQS